MPDAVRGLAEVGARLRRNWGVDVRSQPGWQHRGRGRLTPRGYVAHHTASSQRGGRYASLDLVTHGRAGLDNALCNLYVPRGPGREIWIIAAGTAWHAGRGSWQGVSGNSSVVGCELENDGVGEDWHADALYTNRAAEVECCRVFGFAATRRCEHKEWCVDPATEALTPRGWTHHSELSPGDLILTLNKETWQSEWQPVQEISRWHHDGPMVSLEGVAHSSLSTPDHKWPVRHSDSGPWAWVKSRNMGDRASRIYRAVPHQGFPSTPKYTDGFVQAVAWWWTEGSAVTNTRGIPNRGQIGQSHKQPDHVQSIRAALTEAFGPAGSPGEAPFRGPGNWYESENDGMALFNLRSEAVQALNEVAPYPEKIVDPSFYSDLTRAQLDMVIRASVNADGYAVGDHGGFRIGQANLARLESFQVACSLAGISTSLAKRTPTAGWSDNRHGSDDYWAMSGSRRNTTVRPYNWNTARSLVDYDGLVWCPSVENETWLARRDGTVYFTGNTSRKIDRNKIDGAAERQAVAEWIDTGPGQQELVVTPEDEAKIEAIVTRVVNERTPYLIRRELGISADPDLDEGPGRGYFGQPLAQRIRKIQAQGLEILDRLRKEN